MIRKVTVRRVPSHPPLSCRTEGGVTAALFLQRRRLAKAAMTSDLPLAGEMSGRTEGGCCPASVSDFSAHHGNDRRFPLIAEVFGTKPDPARRGSTPPHLPVSRRLPG
ncbi:MAG: hypothetical protein EOQ29_19335 [Mesorhizobium sp.]|nr:MAG: hypothetical protein EOQ29_19335 [Mesorhizobium sp.]